MMLRLNFLNWFCFFLTLLIFPFTAGGAGECETRFSVDQLDFGAPHNAVLHRTLKRAGITSVKDLEGKTREELLAIPGIGTARVGRILTALKDLEKKEPVEQNAAVPADSDSAAGEELYISIEDFGLGANTEAILKGAGIHTVHQLVDKTMGELLKIPGMSSRYMSLLGNLAQHGLDVRAKAEKGETEPLPESDFVNLGKKIDSALEKAGVRALDQFAGKTVEELILQAPKLGAFDIYSLGSFAAERWSFTEIETTAPTVAPAVENEQETRARIESSLRKAGVYHIDRLLSKTMEEFLQILVQTPGMGIYDISPLWDRLVLLKMKEKKAISLEELGLGRMGALLNDRGITTLGKLTAHTREDLLTVGMRPGEVDAIELVLARYDLSLKALEQPSAVERVREWGESAIARIGGSAFGEKVKAVGSTAVQATGNMREGLGKSAKRAKEQENQIRQAAVNSDKQEHIDLSLEELAGLSPGVRHELKEYGIDNVVALIRKTREELLKIPGMGEKKVDHIERTLSSYNMHLKTSVEETAKENQIFRRIREWGASAAERLSNSAVGPRVNALGQGVKNAGSLVGSRANALGERVKVAGNAVVQTAGRVVPSRESLREAPGQILSASSGLLSSGRAAAEKTGGTVSSGVNALGQGAKAVGTGLQESSKRAKEQNAQIKEKSRERHEAKQSGAKEAAAQPKAEPAPTEAELEHEISLERLKLEPRIIESLKAEGIYTLKQFSDRKLDELLAIPTINEIDVALVVYMGLGLLSPPAGSKQGEGVDIHNLMDQMNQSAGRNLEELLEASGMSMTDAALAVYVRLRGGEHGLPRLPHSHTGESAVDLPSLVKKLKELGMSMIERLSSVSPRVNALGQGVKNAGSLVGSRVNALGEKVKAVGDVAAQTAGRVVPSRESLKEAPGQILSASSGLLSSGRAAAEKAGGAVSSGVNALGQGARAVGTGLQESSKRAKEQNAQIKKKSVERSLARSSSYVRSMSLKKLVPARTARQLQAAGIHNVGQFIDKEMDELLAIPEIDAGDVEFIMSILDEYHIKSRFHRANNG